MSRTWEFDNPNLNDSYTHAFKRSALTLHENFHFSKHSWQKLHLLVLDLQSVLKLIWPRKMRQGHKGFDSVRTQEFPSMDSLFMFAMECEAFPKFMN